MNVAALVPSYGRPEYLGRALTALFTQTLPPRWVLVVARADDHDTWRVAESATPPPGTSVRVVAVAEPGYLPPIITGRAAVPREADIVVVVDDDGEPEPDALARLLSHYADPSVGAVGGRFVEYFEGRRAAARRVDRVGCIGWDGRICGNTQDDLVPPLCRDVSFMREGWMSFRREVFAKLLFRPEMNVDVAIHYGVDLGLQVRSMNLRVLFDSESRFHHFNAPRPGRSGREAKTVPRTRAFAHNLTYLQLLHLRGVHRAVALAFNFLVGDSENWGLVRALGDPLLHGHIRWRRHLWASYAGKMDAVRTFRRVRPSPSAVARPVEANG